MSLKQRALLEQRLLDHARHTHSPARLATPSPQPLSWAQESLWFFDQLVPNSPLYNIPQAFRLSGPLDRGALQQAFAAVVDRHDALRTRFYAVDGAPMQTARPASFEMGIVDLSHLPAMDRERNWQRLLDEEVKRPFDLTTDLMIRARLFCLADDAHILAISLHHIVSDFASLAILLDEVDTLYEAFLENRPANLPELPLQFADWAARSRERGEAAARGPSMAYCQQSLAGAQLDLKFPTDRPRTGVQTFVGSRRPIYLPPNLTAALRRTASEAGVTLYMLLLAAWQTLLFRYSGQEDIVVGSPMGQRGNPDDERIIGLLLNTVLLRGDLSGNPAFSDLLGRVREVVLGAFAHQELPFEKLVEAVHGSQQQGRNAACRVIFQYLPAAPPIPKLKGVAAELLETETGTAKFELTLTLMESGGRLTGDLEYNTDLFDSSTIGRMLANFSVLLEGVASDPGQRISSLPVLTAAEKALVLETWNRTTTDYPRDACVHHVFEEQAARCPDATALIFGEQSITYQELDRRANHLARFLRRHGLGPGSRAALCLERSPDMIAGLLAILKIGAAYVPLDPKYPRDRLAFMLRDAGASVVLTSSEFADVQPAGTNLILLDREQEAISLEPHDDLPRRGAAGDLAYIMYTSGSTGQPKGVAIPHRGVVRLVKGARYASFDPSEVFLQFAPICFDASTFEIWGPLLNGARLVLYPVEFESLEQMADILRRHKVTTLWLTSGLFHQVVDQKLDGFETVRQLLAGGDVLSAPHISRFLERLPQCQLINGYGPTENTTFTCCYQFPNRWDATRPAPIGRPVENTQVYLLDRHLAPVPIGAPGELCIGGDGLALRYLNASELTDARFVANPFRPGGKLYKTGDQARFLADGVIEFLGRTDDQVKINGFRMHLSEVEAALRELPGVREAAVSAEQEPGGSKQLVAWIAPKGEVSVAQLRQQAAVHLPRFMIPAHFILIDALPLTPNGKVDRQRLPRPTESSPLERAPAPQTTPAQEQILQIWRTVFERDDISVVDNFFDLGGHSLLATRLVSRLNAAFQTNLSIAALFQAPTIPALEAKLARAREEHPAGPIRRRTDPSR